MRELAIQDGNRPRNSSQGSHTIKSNDSTVTLDTEARQNYFVWQEVKMGVLQTHAKLHIVDTAKGEAGVRNCTLAAQSLPAWFPEHRGQTLYLSRVSVRSNFEPFFQLVPCET